ncbi:MAG TPA: sialate O-acetylesterase, partial [Opitutaceae bacterium]
MRTASFRRTGLALAAALATNLAGLAAEPQAKTELPLLSPLFGDNMVLQRGKPNRFWGWAKPGENIRVEVGGLSAAAAADPTGKWIASLEVPPAGGPYTVTVHGSKDLVLHNVMVGDVWVCGGQSNMFLGVGATNGGADEIKTANHPDLRLFVVSQKAAYSPSPAPAGTWKVCTPETLGEGGLGGFSAVAYYFARRVQSDVHVPIGLIQDCVGGSTAEAWMSGTTLASLGEFAPQIAGIDRLRAAGAPEYGSFLMHWLDDYDAGAKGDTWAAPGLDDSAWRTVDVPGAFAELGVADAPSVVWFRREITLPDPLPAGEAKIFLGQVEKMDTTYINGKWVGSSSWVENPRIYPVAEGVLRPGRNVIALRIFKLRSADSFLDKPDVLRIQIGDAPPIALSGKWRAVVSVDSRPPHPMPLDFENYATMPVVFYHGMIEPVAPLAIAGALWYQGEANFTRPGQYAKLLAALIADWRALFGQGDIPFYIVSLPAFMHRKAKPSSDGWTMIREVQAHTAATVPQSGLAVTADTGDADNIHPKDKKIVGERLALCALAGHYGVNVPFQGPTFASLEPTPGGLRLHFSNLAGGLVVRGPELVEF